MGRSARRRRVIRRRRCLPAAWPIWATRCIPSRWASSCAVWARPRDLAIEDLLVPQQIFVKNRLDVQGTLRVEGYVNQELLVQTLFETSPGKMEPVSASHVQARQDGQRLPIEGHYIPEQPGEYKVTLRLAAAAGRDGDDLQ